MNDQISFKRLTFISFLLSAIIGSLISLALISNSKENFSDLLTLTVVKKVFLIYIFTFFLIFLAQWLFTILFYINLPSTGNLVEEKSIKLFNFVFGFHPPALNKTGYIIKNFEEVNGVLQGKIQVQNEKWNAVSDVKFRDKLLLNSVVEVVGMKGLNLIVKPIGN